MQYRDFDVTVTIRMTTRVTFARKSGDGMCGIDDIKLSDARANGIGALPYGWLEQAEDEGWDVAYPIDADAVEVDGLRGA